MFRVSDLESRVLVVGVRAWGVGFGFCGAGFHPILDGHGIQHDSRAPNLHLLPPLMFGDLNSHNVFWPYEPFGNQYGPASHSYRT